MTASEKKLQSVCFTGHRPEKLDEPESVTWEKSERAVRQMVADGYRFFISGMSKGFDIYAAEITLQLRADDPRIRLICAVPFEGFANTWDAEWKARYDRILNSADEVHYICAHYSRACFHIRNEWMVKHASHVLAAYRGHAGGTESTMKYAKRAGIPIKQI